MNKVTQVLNIVVTGVVMIAGQAYASCSSNSLNQEQLETELVNKTICLNHQGKQWQEYHQAGGDLIDYKEGPGHPIDPSKKVGTWSIVGTGTNAKVRYNYGSGGVYEYSVHPGVAGLTLCGNNQELPVTVVNSKGPC